MSENKNPRIFLSYAWGGESEIVVKEIEHVFKSKHLNIIRDKTNGLGFKGLVTGFMQQIGKGNYVIVILSDKYLKSKNCMFELLEVYKNGNFYNRIFPIVLKDAKIYDSEDIIDYTDFWDEKIAKLEEKIKISKRLSNRNRVHRDLDLYEQIRNTIDHLLDILSNMNTLSIDIHQNEEYNTVLTSIIRQINEKMNFNSIDLVSNQNIKIISNSESITLHGIEFILVKGGEYKMGFQSSRDGIDDDMKEAKPLHSVKLNDYYIGKYPVTQEQWLSFMEGNPSYFRGSVYNPVENVCWYDCIEFIEKLNKTGNKLFRLPTEAEWEFAARGGRASEGFRFSGSNNLEKIAWYGENAGKRTHPVGKKAPNELGIFDMSGNVWEWCNDWYDEAYYNHSPFNNPYGPKTGKCKVLRGSSWYDLKNLNRIAIRYKLYPKARYFDIGLRLAMDFPPN